jgi:TetR/AcrR family transcriptional repressor of bet genes
LKEQMQTAEAPRSRFAPPEERRRQLIQATLQVVAERGLMGTKISDVTERAGLSVGAVNHHFKSKEELLTATLAYMAEELQAQWYPVLLDTTLSPADRLVAIVDHLYDPKVCTPVKIAVWFAFFGDAHYRQVYRDMVKAFDHERTTAIARISAALKEEGGYAGADPEAIAQSIESLADGLWLALLLYPERVSREAARQQTRALLATHFPRHFDTSTDVSTRTPGADQCLGVQ